MKLWVVRGFLKQLSLADADVDTVMGDLMLYLTDDIKIRERKKIFGQLSELLDFAFSVIYRL